MLLDIPNCDNDKRQSNNQTHDITSLNKKLKRLTTQIHEAVNTAVVTAINSAKQEANNGRKEQQDNVEDNDGTIDMETMSNKELGDYILKQVGKVVGELVKPLNEKISGVQSTTEEDRIRAEAVIVSKEEPMFMHMGKEMGDIAKRHPDLSVRDIFNLAKINNPEKVEELEKELKGDEDKKKEEEGEPSIAFGGLLPTSGVKSSEKSVVKMKQRVGANKAVDDEVKDVPAHILSGETT